MISLIMIAAAAAAAPADVRAMSCEDLALALTEQTAGAVSTAARTQELAQKGQGPSMLEQTMKAQALGTVLSALPGKGAGMAASVIGMAERTAEEKKAQERAAASRELEAVTEDQLQGLERLLALHEEHQARCPQ